MKRVRITNDSVNSYGTRVLTAGIDLTQYRKNPVLLYMHRRGEVIGTLEDLQVGETEITGVPKFDMASELSRRCAKQWEAGSLRMTSVGIDVLETSDAAELALPGQRYATITKSRLSEVSVVDIGANDDAIALRKGGKAMTFGEGGECGLPPLEKEELKMNNEELTKQPKNENEMETKKLAAALGLPETADETAVLNEISSLRAAAQTAEELGKRVETMECRTIIDAVEEAIADKRINPDKKEFFTKLGKKVGSEELKETLAAMAPQVKLSKLVEDGGEGKPAKTWRDYTPEELKLMKEERRERYAQLYRGEYGVELPQ